ADELGLDPSADATSLYEQLLRGPASSSAVRRPGTGLPPLVGREPELAELLRVGRDHQIAVVPARSGWGKSRLLDELCQRADRPVLFARALVSERDEPWSLVRGLLDTAPVSELDLPAVVGPPTLAALSPLLPGVDAPASSADARSRRALIRQGILRVVQATAPSLVVLDDLQWADSSSLSALAQIVGRSADVALVAAYRPDEVAEGSPVARFVDLLAETRPLEVVLPALGSDALQQLVERPSVAAALAEHTDGSPFAVLQTARTLEREGLLRRAASGGWDAVAEHAPDRVREVAHAGQRDAVWRQFERLPPSAQELAALLAVVGRPVPVRLIAFALGLETDGAMRELQELARGHLVRHDAAGFRADHDLVGETIRDRLDPVTAAQLHQRVADALTATDGPMDEIARHLAAAGDTAAATSAYVAAASARLERHANREAAQLAAEGLALDPAPPERSLLLEVRAETLFRHADLDAARGDLRAALLLTTERTPRSRLLTRLAELTAGAVDVLEATELAELAVAEAGEDLPARGRALYVRALMARNRLFSAAHQLPEDQRASVEAQFDEALEIFTEIGDAGGIADILDARAMNTFGFGDITGGIAELGRVARLFADSGNLLRVVMPRSTRGHGLMMAGRETGGLAETSAAVELARSLGYGEGEAYALWHHSEVLASCGRLEDALATADAGLALARRLEHRGFIAITGCAQGFVRAAAGDLAGAAAAFEESLAMIQEENRIFAGWAHSRLAQTYLRQARVEEAAVQVEAALDTRIGLQLYEARLARCELAVVRGDADRAALIEDARRRAVEGGHFASAQRLDQLAE
ncbi:MAG: ATP-binding protein, partial [Marmoricola sp.]